MAKERGDLNHIGIIMDGNGRWAKQRNMPRSKGHREGLDAAKRIVKAASDLEIPYISLYVFSTENWKRTEEEVSFLMSLVKKHLRAEYQFYKDNHIKVVHSGDLKKLPADVQQEIKDIAEQTSHFDGLTVNLLINYGGRDEIVRAVNRAQSNGETFPISEEILQKYTDQSDIPPVDLVIRTGGEQRLSNFLIWQTAYSEYYFSEKCWPDWTREDLEEALNSFGFRDRRFGGVNV